MTGSRLRLRKTDGKEIFDVKKERHLKYWVSQPVDVYLVIRQQNEASGQETIRWMNLTRYLKRRNDKTSRQIVFDGEKLDAPAVWRLRGEFFPPNRGQQRVPHEAAQDALGSGSLKTRQRGIPGTREAVQLRHCALPGEGGAIAGRERTLI